MAITETLHEYIDAHTTLIDCRLYRPQLAACYLIADSEELMLIDCGTRHSVPQILEAITAIGAHPEQVRWIIPTHVHLDHASGAGMLMQYCPNATLVAHPRGIPHLVDPSKLQTGATAVYGEAAFARHFGTLEPVPRARTQASADGERLALGRRELLFIHTPGHANHHGCILDTSNGHLFTGDTFGLGYRELAQPSPFLVATTTPVAFDPDTWLGTLKRLLALDSQVVCLTHYGCYPRPEVLAPMLRESIEAHRHIALEEEPREKEGREQRLREAVGQLLVETAVAHTGLSRESVHEMLIGDITLNAQGLAVWLARRARR